MRNAAKLLPLLALAWALPTKAAPDYFLWLLDEGRGNAAVDSGTHGTDMEIVSPAWADDGPFPGTCALQFNGTDTHGFVATPISVGELSIEMWVRPKRLTGGQFLLSTKFTSTSRLYLTLTNGDLTGQDDWWQSSRKVTAKDAFTKDDLGKWSHVAFTMGPAGYKLYKNGKLLAEKEGKPFSSQSGRLALGVSAWDLKSGLFQGDMAQVRLSFTQLEPGKGSGKDELAWAASLESHKLVPPTLEWLPNPLRRGNLFMRDERPKLTLRVRNRFYEPLPPMTVSVSVRDMYIADEHAPIVVKIDEALPPRSDRDLEVDLGITRAGVYKVTVAGPGGSQAGTQATLILGPPPEDPVGPLSFFGNSSHTRITEYEYTLRREFGSRAERGSQILWGHLQKKPGEFLWGPIDQDPIKTIAQAKGIRIFGFCGYTPKFAVAISTKDKYTGHEVPNLDYYVQWLEAAAKHYDGVVDTWEVLNEPNGAGAFIKGSAEQLADLHKAAALAVRRIDPKLKTVGASLVSIDPEFMDRLRDAGALDYMDVIAFHNYVWDYPPDQRIALWLKRIIAWRDKHAPGRPLWDDEWAPYLKYTADNPARYANWTARQLIITKALGIQHSDNYTWNGHPNRLWLDGHWATPAALAYRTTAQLLTNAMPTAIVSEGKDGIYAYVFKRRDDLILVGWTSPERQESTFAAIPVHSGAVTYDLMGNASPVAGGKRHVSLVLTNSPTFLKGVVSAFLRGRKRLAPPANEPPPRVHPSLWYSFHYPKTSEVFSLPLGATREIELRVYNDGHKAAIGRLRLKSDDLKLSTKKIDVRVPSRSSQTVRFQVRAPKRLSEGIHRIAIKGTADGLSFGLMRIRCYVAPEEVTVFHMATWEMVENMTKAEKTGQGIHIRWVEPGGFMEFRFDLSNVTAARLQGYMDSVSPSPVDGGNFCVRASNDGKKWDTLLDGTGKFAWREVDLTSYVGKPVLVRFENSSEKGEARLKEMRLLTMP